MNALKEILNSKTASQAYKSVHLDFVKGRYTHASLLTGFLSFHALNKEKNKDKPSFENLELIVIFNHLMSEIHEVGHEIFQTNINYEKLLDEIGDCAALLTGLIAYIMKHKDDKSEEGLVINE